MKRLPSRAFGLFAGMLLIACQQPAAWSAEWDTGFDIAPSVVFTDNVCLDDDNKKSEWIGSLKPELRVSGTGQRGYVDLSGSLQFHTLDNNNTECNDPFGNRSDSPIPALQFSSGAELVDSWLFLEASALARQNNLNQFRATGNDGLNRSANFNTTTQYQLNPYIARRFKNIASMRVGYTFSDQSNSEDIVGDSTQESFNAAFSSVEDVGPLSWALSAYSTRVEYDEALFGADDTSKLRGATLFLGYQVMRQFQVNGTVGEEDNDFPTDDDDTDGSIWDVGVLYTPNSRISLAAGIGDRFFGSAPRFDVSWRQRRSVFIAKYSRDLNFSRNLRGSGGTDSQIIEVGDDGKVGFGSQLGGFGTPTSVARSPVVDERFTLGYTFTGRRHSIDVQGSSSKQRRTDIDDDSTFSSASVRVSRQLGRFSDAFIRLGWDKREADDRGQDLLTNDSETWRGSLGYTKALGIT